ncbi:MAG TPA: ATP-binding protein [Cytophagaceae bacterium]
MIKSYLLLIPSLALWVSCGGEKKSTENVVTDTVVTDTTTAAPALELVWSTDTVFKTPESVIYDQERDIYYVSNVNGVPTDKDNNGFISKLKTDGTVDSLQWITGLHAPKGMGIFKTSLFVTDIDKLVEIDIEKGNIKKTYPVKGAQFLNDVAIDTAGVVYFTDSGTNKIHTLKNGKVEEWKVNDTLNGPNGLYIEKDRIILSSMGTADLKAINIATKESTVLADSIGAGDGVEAMGGDGTYLVSDWYGQVFKVNPDNTKELLTDTRPVNKNAADIEYVKDKNLLLVPTFGANKVEAYKVNR